MPVSSRSSPTLRKVSGERSKPPVLSGVRLPSFSNRRLRRTRAGYSRVRLAEVSSALMAQIVSIQTGQSSPRSPNCSQRWCREECTHSPTSSRCLASLPLEPSKRKDKWLEAYVVSRFPGHLLYSARPHASPAHAREYRTAYCGLSAPPVADSFAALHLH